MIILIPHRYNLYKWKLSNNPLCVFDNDLHDSVHLFLNCEQSSLFWKRFKDLVKKLYNIDFTCNVYTLISGYNLENKHFCQFKYAYHVCEICSLCHIYLCRKQQSYVS